MSESVTQTVKSIFTPTNLIKIALGFMAMNVVLSLTGLTNWVYNPVEAFKSQFGKQA
jgi:hypothetical protein